MEDKVVVEVKTGFLEEKPGVKSSTRLYSLMTLLMLWALDVLLITAIDFKMDHYFIIFNFVMLIAVFAPKYLHKLAELKIGGIGGKNGNHSGS